MLLDRKVSELPYGEHLSPSMELHVREPDLEVGKLNMWGRA